MSNQDTAPRLGNGTYTYKDQTPATFTLEAERPRSVVEFFEDRDEIRARRDRLQEQAANMDKISQAHSLRGIGVLVTDRFPGAATLRISENLDGERSYDPVSILDKDGNVLQSREEDDDFMFEEMVQDGVNLQELVWDLSYEDDSWAAGGVGVINPGNKRDYKTVDIDLAAARDAPIPFIAAEHSPYTRSFSEDEQRDLVEAANHGVAAIEDILEDNNSFDEHRQFEELADLKERVNTLLTVTRQPE